MSTAVERRSIEEAIQPRRLRGRRRPMIDPWIVLAALGLMAVSLFSIAGATKTDIAGNPSYYLTRQEVYFALGTVIAIFVGQSYIDLLLAR